MENSNDCLFCKIVKGKIPAKIIEQNDYALAFYDLNPKAKLHALVIPKKHYSCISQVASQSPKDLSELIILGQKIADKYNKGSFKLLFNTGKDSGQTVFHAHGHILCNPNGNFDC